MSADDSDAALVDRVVDLEVQVSVWREIAQQGIHALHEREIQIKRLQESVRLLREEFRTGDRRDRQGGRP
jgi:hypothetical protein